MGCAFFRPSAARGAVAHMADGSIAGKVLQRRLAEGVLHQAERAMGEEAAAIGRDDARALLTAMLQRMEAEVGEVRSLLRAPDAEHTAPWGRGRGRRRSVDHGPFPPTSSGPPPSSQDRPLASSSGLGSASGTSPVRLPPARGPLDHPERRQEADHNRAALHDPGAIPGPAREPGQGADRHEHHGELRELDAHVEAEQREDTRAPG